MTKMNKQLAYPDKGLSKKKKGNSWYKDLKTRKKMLMCSKAARKMAWSEVELEGSVVGERKDESTSRLVSLKALQKSLL